MSVTDQLSDKAKPEPEADEAGRLPLPAGEGAGDERLYAWLVPVAILAAWGMAGRGGGRARRRGRTGDGVVAADPAAARPSGGRAVPAAAAGPISADHDHLRDRRGLEGRHHRHRCLLPRPDQRHGWRARHPRSLLRGRPELRRAALEGVPARRAAGQYADGPDGAAPLSGPVSAVGHWGRVHLLAYGPGGLPLAGLGDLPHGVRVRGPLRRGSAGGGICLHPAPCRAPAPPLGRGPLPPAAGEWWGTGSARPRPRSGLPLACCPSSARGGPRHLGPRRPRRDTYFLQMAERHIYGKPNSPYRPLLDLAGYDLPGLRQLVHARGLDAALDQLWADGVYVRVGGFKGMEPVTRGGHTFHFTQRDFANPLVRGIFRSQSSGSRSRGTATEGSASDFLDGVRHRRWLFEQYGGGDCPGGG